MTLPFMMSSSSQSLFPRFLTTVIPDPNDVLKAHAWLETHKAFLRGMLIISISDLLMRSDDSNVVAAATRLAEAGQLEGVIEAWLAQNGFKIGQKDVTVKGSGDKAKTGVKGSYQIKGAVKKGEFSTESETAIEGVLLKTKLVVPDYLGDSGSYSLLGKTAITEGWENDKPFDKMKAGFANKLTIGKFTTEIFLGMSAKEKELKFDTNPELSIKGKYKYGFLTGSLEYDIVKGYAAAVAGSTRSGIHSLELKVGYNDKKGESSFTGSYGVDLSGGKKQWLLGLDVKPSSQPVLEWMSVKLKYAF